MKIKWYNTISFNNCKLKLTPGTKVWELEDPYS